MATYTWITGWYNPRRRHSDIEQKSLINVKKELQGKANAPKPVAARLTPASGLKI